MLTAICASREQDRSHREPGRDAGEHRRGSGDEQQQLQQRQSRAAVLPLPGWLQNNCMASEQLQCYSHPHQSFSCCQITAQQQRTVPLLLLLRQQVAPCACQATTESPVGRSISCCYKISLLTCQPASSCSPLCTHAATTTPVLDIVQQTVPDLPPVPAALSLLLARR